MDSIIIVGDGIEIAMAAGPGDGLGGDRFIVDEMFVGGTGADGVGHFAGARLIRLDEVGL